jgi:hypothetical protein
MVTERSLKSDKGRLLLRLEAWALYDVAAKNFEERKNLSIRLTCCRRVGINNSGTGRGSWNIQH